ncbi:MULTISPECIES: hypothetical protein [unclassified Nocardia]|uniref:hypothetical protein n=1 Tax=unclassified Nocardia TaxID=2637762 RepID=UPI001CE47CFD|nr:MULTISPECIES: hypothetical protein [unclassified Nocardia]
MINVRNQPLFPVTVVNATHRDSDGHGDRWVATLTNERMHPDWIAAALAADPRMTRVWCETCGAHAHLCPEIAHLLPEELLRVLGQVWAHYFPPYRI